MFSAGLAGMSIGPCAAAATFAVTGNTWHVQTLQHVILVGMVLAVVPVLALMCFDDDLSLGAESDAVQHHGTSAEHQTSGETIFIVSLSPAKTVLLYASHDPRWVLLCVLLTRLLKQLTDTHQLVDVWLLA